MNFEVDNRHQYTLLVSKVEKLDSTVSSILKSELTLLNKAGINSIILDLSKTSYCDSSGLSAVLLANRLCRDAGGQFILCGLNPNVLKLIEISQLDKVLNIAETIETADQFFKVIK